MSLCVSVFIYDENGNKKEIGLEAGKDLAGFENSRFKLYGSELAEYLGLKILPQLKAHDLYDIKGEELNRVENELRIIIENVDQFAEVSGYEKDYILARIQNILDAVRLAGKENGVIVIW